MRLLLVLVSAFLAGRASPSWPRWTWVAFAAAAALVTVSGCSDPVLTAARITLAADQTILEGERQFGAWDLEHQHALPVAELPHYRTAQRPKVTASFAALTAAAHEARLAVELAHGGKLAPAPIVASVCEALAGVATAGAELGWHNEVVSTGVTLCKAVTQ